MPSSLGIWEKEGGDGVSFDHVWDNFKPVQAKERTGLTPTLKMKTQWLSIWPHYVIEKQATKMLNTLPCFLRFRIRTKYGTQKNYIT